MLFFYVSLSVLGIKYATGLFFFFFHLDVTVFLRYSISPMSIFIKLCSFLSSFALRRPALVATNAKTTLLSLLFFRVVNYISYFNSTLAKSEKIIKKKERKKKMIIHYALRKAKYVCHVSD